MDWPIAAQVPGWPPAVTSIGRYSAARAWRLNFSSSFYTTTANEALYSPVLLPSPYRVRTLGWYNGSVVSGNVDAGIYAHDGTRIVSTGSTAQSGTTTIQTVDITDTDLSPGLYYFAAAIDNATGEIGMYSLDIVRNMIGSGHLQESSAFPLPATATFAAISGDRAMVVLAIGGRIL